MVQLQVLNYILANKDPSPIILHNLSAKHFSEYKDEFNFIKNHYDTYGNVPDLETFISTFNDFEVINVTESIDYLIDELFNDYKTRNMAETFNKIRALLMSGKIAEAEEIYKRGVEGLSDGTAIKCIDLLHDTSRYDDFIDRSLHPDKYYLTTGFRELDKILGGIDLQEDLGVIIARTNKGKSWILLKMAAAAASAGLRVGLYSGEMTEKKVGYRLDTLLSHIQCGALMHGNASVQNQYKDYIDSLPTKYAGCLKILTTSMVNGPIGVGTLRAFIEKEKLDILFVDQIPLLSDDRHGRTKEERYSNIIIDLKNLQSSKLVPIISVSQQNRTKNEDKDDDSIDTAQIAGSDDIGKYATWVLGISRDKKDETILTIQIVKARDGGVGTKLNYCVDLGTGVFTYIPNETDGVEDKDIEEDYSSRYDMEEASGDDIFR